MDEATKHYKAMVNGRRSKAAGEYWERMIEASCEYYSKKGIAEISKTPEPMRPIKSLPGGKFVAIFTKMAQPDYKGSLKGGRAVVFEAKHTDSDRLKQSAVSSEQEAQLNRHAALGAECFVLISFGFEQYFKVPWAVFADMKRIFGRKYIAPKDLQQYRIYYRAGVLRFIE